MSFALEEQDLKNTVVRRDACGRPRRRARPSSNHHRPTGSRTTTRDEEDDGRRIGAWDHYRSRNRTRMRTRTITRDEEDGWSEQSSQFWPLIVDKPHTLA